MVSAAYAHRVSLLQTFPFINFIMISVISVDSFSAVFTIVEVDYCIDDDNAIAIPAPK